MMLGCLVLQRKSTLDMLSWAVARPTSEPRALGRWNVVGDVTARYKHMCPVVIFSTVQLDNTIS